MNGFGVRKCLRGLLSLAPLAALAASGCGGGEKPAQAPAASTKPASAFTELEELVFVPRCALPGCHEGESPSGGMNLGAGQAYRSLVGVPAQRRPERLRVKPGDPEASYLVQRLTGVDTPPMPLGAEPLKPELLEKVRRWIREGAKP